MESLDCLCSSRSIFLGRAIFSITALLGSTLILVGLLVLYHGRLVGLAMSGFALLWLVFVSRLYYIPVKITGSQIVTKFLFWTRRIPMCNISKITVKRYDRWIPLTTKTEKVESIFMRVDGLFLRYVFWLNVPAEKGVGDFICKQVQATGNSKAMISVS
ncbi:MAG: hypothetical protein AB7E32_17590 [Desulfovibrio sp.]